MAVLKKIYVIFGQLKRKNQFFIVDGSTELEK